MLNSNDLLNAIKKAAMDAVNTSQPSDFYFGEVMSVSPLKISIEQKLVLGSAQLVLTQNVTNYKITIDFGADFKTEDEEYNSTNNSAFQKHNHKISAKKEITIQNSLQTGEKVILLKQKGGQKYLVLDRVVNA